MTLMIIMTTYTAVLATRNIMYTKEVPISGMEDPKATHPSDDFKIATFKGGLNSRMFEESNKTTWRGLGNFMKKYNFQSSEEAFDSLINGTLQAVIIDKIHLKYRWKSNTYCNLQVVENIVRRSYGFALSHGSR